MDIIVLSLKTTVVVMATGVDTLAPPLPGVRRPRDWPREFNKPYMRMKISVGAMPCVIGVLSPHRLSPQVANTHIDLHGHGPDDVLGGVVDGKEDAENKLRDQIEHAALDDDDDCTQTCFSLEVRA